MTHSTPDPLRETDVPHMHPMEVMARNFRAKLRAALAAAPQPAPAPAADERDEIERIICDAFTCDLRGRGDEDGAFWQTAADALLAAGYRKADACADAPETLAWAGVVDGDVVWVDAGMGRKRDVADIVAEEEGGKPVRVAIRVVEDEA